MDIRTPAESYSRLPYSLKIGGNSAKNRCSFEQTLRVNVVGAGGGVPFIMVTLAHREVPLV